MTFFLESSKTARLVSDQEVPLSFPDEIQTILQAAMKAPSTGNAQPWSFRYSNGKISFYLKPQQLQAILDFQNKAPLVSTGASIENAVIAGKNSNSNFEVSLFPDGQYSPFIAELSTHTSPSSHEFCDLYPYLSKRQMSQVHRTTLPLLPKQLEQIGNAIQSIPGAKLYLLEDPTHLITLGEIVDIADQLQFRNRYSLQESMREFRQSATEAYTNRDEVFIDNLLTQLKEQQHDHGLGSLSGNVFKTASVAGLITMPGSQNIDYVSGGRAMQRGWLTATKLGIDFYPFTALCHQFTRLSQQDDLDPESAFVLNQLRQRYLKLFPLTKGNGEILLFRLASAN